MSAPAAYCSPATVVGNRRSREPDESTPDGRPLADKLVCLDNPTALPGAGEKNIASSLPAASPANPPTTHMIYA